MIFPLFDRNPTRRIPWLTLLLIVVNLGIAWNAHTLSDKETLDLVYEYGLVPQRLSLMESGKPLNIRKQFEAPQGALPVVYETSLATDRWSVYRSLLTTMFLHGGWLHVLSNMWMLWIFGNNIEDRLGHLVFAGFYLTGGIVASYCQWAIDPASQTPIVGASGAVAALLGGYAVTYPQAKVKSILFVGFPLLLDLPAVLVIAVWFALQLLNGVLPLFGQGLPADPVAYWAHIGGCVSGVLLIPILSIGASPPEADWRSESEAMLEPINAPEQSRRE